MEKESSLIHLNINIALFIHTSKGMNIMEKTMANAWENKMKKRTNEMIIYSTLIVLSSMDISLTLHAISMGFIEGNPLMAYLLDISVALAIAVKYIIIIIPAVIGLLFARKKTRELWIKIMIIPVIITGVVVIHNIVLLIIH